MNLEEIIKDVKNNDINKLEEYLYKRFSGVHNSNLEYVSKTSVEIKFEDLNVSSFNRMLEILDCNVKLYKSNITCIPFVMIELLPTMFGIELWVYETED